MSASSFSVRRLAPRPCKGMQGIVEEGQEVMQEGEKKDDASADLALIGAAQRVEHYEISGYTTARNLAQQLRHSAVVSLLSKSLAEEENADQLLNQVARSLMSVAGMPAAIEQTGKLNRPNKDVVAANSTAPSGAVVCCSALPISSGSSADGEAERQ